MKRYWIGALVAGSLAIAVASFHRGRDDARPHERHGRGECASCHDEAPRHHRERRWEVAHGHAEPEVAARCETCHQPETCVACHEHEPSTHTAGFLRPVDGTDDAGLHTVLGRAHPASCVVCHDAPGTECSGCHGADEARAWTDDADEDLDRWRELLRAR